MTAATAEVIRIGNDDLMKSEEGNHVDRDLRQIQIQISEINRNLGGITAILERNVEDRREFARALGDFRDDITELMALGPKVAEVQERAIRNEAKIETIEKWRNRTIGARMAVHTIFGAIGGSVVLGGELLWRIINSAPHR